jgi:aminocarboxymuconate-semialdehyde decarboxylase
MMQKAAGRSGRPQEGRRRFVTRAAWAAAAALGPRLSGAQGVTASATGAIDMHAHWTPEPYAKAMADLGRPTFANGSALNPLMYDLAQRVAWMDERNIRTHVLTLSGNMPWWWAEPADAIHLARVTNEAGLDAHRRYPDRFLLGIAVPAGQPDAALDYLFGPDYAPFLARCEALGYPLLFHPLDFPPNYFAGPDRLAGPTFLYNTLGFPTEHANTAEKFIVTGTLDRFPRLKILLAHAGGSFPYIAARLSHAIDKGVSKIKLEHPFADYVRRFHYDTLTYSSGGLRYLIDTVGIDRVVIGTDVFAAMDVAQPMYLVDQLNLSATDRDLILRGNALAMMNP